MPSMSDLLSKNYIYGNAYSFHGVVWTRANSVFFLREGNLEFTLPSAGDYATGIFFIDTDPNKVNI